MLIFAARCSFIGFGHGHSANDRQHPCSQDTGSDVDLCCCRMSTEQVCRNETCLIASHRVSSRACCVCLQCPCFCGDNVPSRELCWSVCSRCSERRRLFTHASDHPHKH